MVEGVAFHVADDLFTSTAGEYTHLLVVVDSAQGVGGQDLYRKNNVHAVPIISGTSTPSKLIQTCMIMLTFM